MSRHLFCPLVLSDIFSFGATDSAAQVWTGGGGPRPGAVEISGGGTWIAGQELSDRDAILTPNPGAGFDEFELFTTQPTLKSAIGAQALIGYYVTRTFAIEGGVHYSRPTLSVRLAGDF